MKKILFSIVILCLFFFACKKETEPAKDSVSDKKYPVIFNVGTLSQTVTPYARTAAMQAGHENGLGVYAHYLYYLVFNSKGDQVGYSRQDSSDKMFGTVSDSLAVGSYTVVLIATKGLVLDELSVSEPRSLIEKAVYICSDCSVRDTYLKKVKFTVDAKDNSLQVQLARIHGRLEVSIENYVESHRYEVFIDSESVRYAIGLGKALEPQQMYRSLDRVGQRSFETLILNTVAPFTLRIRESDEIGQPIAEKTIDGIRCYENKRTVVKGRLLPPTPNSFFTISVDDAWSSDTVNVHLK